MFYNGISWFTFPQTANVLILYCWVINGISRSRSTQLWNIVITLIRVTMVWTMCLKSLLPVYFLSLCWCSVTLWQPTVFYSVLVLHLRTHSILKQKNLKELQQAVWGLLLFCNQCCALSQYTVQRTIQVIPWNRNCGILVEWKNIVYNLSFKLLTFL